jgi:transcriptional regulator GlxA family with amidase domain
LQAPTTRPQARPGRFHVRTIGQTVSEAVTAGGLSTPPDRALATRPHPRPQTRRPLILPGSAAWDECASRDDIEVAKAFLKAGSSVAAICGATAGLVRAGVLDDRPHTRHARGYVAATGAASWNGKRPPPRRAT